MVFSLSKFLIRMAPVFILAAISTAATGCSSGISVSGKVTVDDKPLTTGGVTFVPDKEKGNTSTEEAHGQITEAGTYEMYTNNQKGVTPGFYKVLVVAQDKPDISKPTEVKSLIDSMYNKVETTPLKIEVKPDGDFNLKLSGPSVTAPNTTRGGVPPMPKK